MLRNCHCLLARSFSYVCPDKEVGTVWKLVWCILTALFDSVCKLGNWITNKTVGGVRTECLTFGCVDLQIIRWRSCLSGRGSWGSVVQIADRFNMHGCVMLGEVTWTRRGHSGLPQCIWGQDGLDCAPGLCPGRLFFLSLLTWWSLKSDFWAVTNDW